MKAGRELDALIAEKVFGLEDEAFRARLALENGLEYGTPHYSTDIAAAWEVVEKMRADEFTYLVGGIVFSGNTNKVVPDHAAMFGKVGYRFNFTQAETAPLAICLAALKAVQA